MEEPPEKLSESICKRSRSTEDNNEAGIVERQQQSAPIRMDTEVQANDGLNSSQSTKTETVVSNIFQSPKAEAPIVECQDEVPTGSHDEGAVGGISGGDGGGAMAHRSMVRQMRQRMRNYRRRSSTPSPTSTSHGGDESLSTSSATGTVPPIGTADNSTVFNALIDELNNAGSNSTEELHRISSRDLFEHQLRLEEEEDDDRDEVVSSSSSVLVDNDDDDDDEEEDEVDDDDDDDEDIDDDDDHNYFNDEVNAADAAEETRTLHEVLGKPKPSYTWIHQLELMRREHGLSLSAHRSLRNGGSGSGFATRFYSSRHVIERMKLSHCLRKHSGCVNCLNFNRQGNLLCTGSDDTRIIVWDWAESKVRHSYKSGHVANIFQAKFIDDTLGCLDIVSTSRDGQVRRAIIPPSGGTKVESSCVYKHRGAVHKLVVSPLQRSEIISVGEDGFICCKDLRSDGGNTELKKVVTGSKKNRKVRLFSIAHHPFKPEMVVCGCDNFVRVYDRRNMANAVHEMCPDHLLETSIPQVTCCVYNSTGSEVLASYSDDHIYLFDNENYKSGEYLHRYRGHYNHKTIKGVNFFGPESEYVISGSDCGNIFYWDKNTESIINFMPGDTMGVVNCLEPHPSIPVLATSGLDHNIKIWTPNSEIYPPDLSKLELCVKRNLKRNRIDEGTLFDDRQFHYFIRQFLRQPHSTQRGRGGHGGGARGGVGVGGGVDSDDGSQSGSAGGTNDDGTNSNPDIENRSAPSSPSSSSDDNEHLPMDNINCRTQ